MSGVPIDSVICADCLEVMREWPDKCVDLVLTDPPYGIGLQYEKSEYTDRKAGYIEMLWPRIVQAERCAQDAVAVFQAAKYAPNYTEWFPRDWRIITVGKLFGQWMPTHLQWRTDFVLYWMTGRKPSEKWQTINTPRDFYVSTVCCATNATDSRQRPDHPCPRPLDTMMWLVDMLSAPDTIILDPFCGSGTTLVAAKMLGRHYVGIDISPDYVSIARQRLEAVDTGVPVRERQRGQLPLFPVTQ